MNAPPGDNGYKLNYVSDDEAVREGLHTTNNWKAPAAEVEFLFVFVVLHGRLLPHLRRVVVVVMERKLKVLVFIFVVFFRHI